MKKYYTIGETAKIIGVSSQTLRRWDSNDKFKSVRHPINNFRVYTDDQINNFQTILELNLPIEKEFPEIELKPYFETNFGKLYNCDVLKFLNSLKSQSVDLIFADPPYNIKKAEWDIFESQKKYLEWSMKWIEEAYRVLSPIGSMYICGFSEILADIKWATNGLFKGCKWLVWFYRNKANLGNNWGRSHESLIHLRKSKKIIFNIDDVRISYNAHTLKYPKRTQAESSQYNNGNKKYLWTPNPKGAKPKDVFEIPTLSNGSWEKTPHLTQKPVELIKKIVLASSNPNSIIVDPFGGSGTTYAVAEALERNWIGTELKTEYCDIIKNRLKDINHIEKIKLGKEELKSKQRREKLRA